jgi:Predicted signal transduction protein with a C-terminal ATPase domain
MFRTLRSKLVAYILAITALVLVALGSISTVAVKSFLRENQVESTRYKLRLAMEGIDREMDRLIQLASWCTVSQEVQLFVNSSATYPDDRRFKALTAYRSIRDAVTGIGLDRYVDKLIVAGFEGHSIQVGLVQGDKGDLAAARSLFQRFGPGDAQQKTWPGLIDGPFPFSEGSRIIPIVRTISSDDESNRQAGFVLVAVNQDLFARFLSAYELEAGTCLYLAMGDRVYAVRGEGSGRGSLRELSPAEAGLTGSVLASASLEGRPLVELRMAGGQGGKKDSLVLVRGRSTGWVLAQSLQPVRLASQGRGLAALLFVVVLFIVILVALVLLTVNRMINEPIARINGRVALVSKGDFSYDPGIEWDNELGDIGRAVNSLSRDLERLIESRVEDEKAKKALEFRALQNQINPHFLYNTLNAVKWMAEIQKSPGIVEIVNALALLLRHAAQGSEELVSLELELELVREYCTIQRYRSANLFEMDIAVRDRALSRCKIVKFTLQPLVENAIMHGIEPKMDTGHIGLEVYRQGLDRVRIDVVDDGVGIEKGAIGGLLRGAARDGEAFNHIGLANVDERLKLAFGEEYGLSIASEEGVYTMVSVLLPYSEEAVCIPS